MKKIKLYEPKKEPQNQYPQPIIIDNNSKKNIPTSNNARLIELLKNNTKYY